jgi:hypothetical protein
MGLSGIWYQKNVTPPGSVILREAKRVILREVAGRRIQKKLTVKNAKKISASIVSVGAGFKPALLFSRGGAEKKGERVAWTSEARHSARSRRTGKSFFRREAPLI